MYFCISKKINKIIFVKGPWGHWGVLKKMNLFFLDLDPKKCAEYHCDKHVVKMILEIVQMLYTAHHLLKTPLEKLPKDYYKKISNHNHPMAIWIRFTSKNYIYSCEIAKELSKEYTYRYKKVHSCDKHLEWLIDNVPIMFLDLNKITKIPLCMPEDSKDPYGDPVKSYRKYYLLHKRGFAKWTGRPIPDWFSYSSITRYF